MQGNSNIDQLFNSKLKAASVESATSGGWAALASQMDKASTLSLLWSRMWVRITSVAILLSIMATSLLFILKIDHTEQMAFTDELFICESPLEQFNLKYYNGHIPGNNLIAIENNNNAQIEPTYSNLTTTSEKESSKFTETEANHIRAHRLAINETADRSGINVSVNQMRESESKRTVVPAAISNNNLQPSIQNNLSVTNEMDNQGSEAANNTVKFAESKSAIAGIETNTIASNNINVSTINKEIKDKAIEESALRNVLLNDLKLPGQERDASTGAILLEGQSTLSTNLFTESIHINDLAFLDGISFSVIAPPPAQFISFPERNKIKTRTNNFAVKAHIGQFLNNTNISSSQTESGQVVNFIKQGLTEVSTQSYGIGLSTNLRHWYFETGLEIAVIEQQEQYYFPDFEFTDNSFWDRFTYTDTQIDTLFYTWQHVNNDTIWTPVLETTTVTVLDSTFVEVFDTTDLSVNAAFANTYKYIEVPMITGYMWSKGKMDIVLKAGAVAGFLTGASGSSVSGTNSESIYALDKTQFPSIRFDIYSGLEARYHIGSRYFIFGDVYYRKPLSSFYSWQGINRENSRYGIKMGLGLYF